MLLRVVHPDPAACRILRSVLEPDAEVVEGRFPDVPPVDAFVTAGNCYGIMNAGIDEAVRARFGRRIMAAVQEVIVRQYLGEQPVGTAFALRTGDPEFPVLVHAPTMRVPGPIVGTDAVYRATFAALVALKHWTDTPVATVAFPAMGTGYGAVPYAECARQMAVAWRHFRNPPAAIGENWDLVLDRERAITGARDPRR